MGEEIHRLRSIPGFPYLANLNKIKGNIINGDPVKDRALQFPDFFVYAPHIKMVTMHKCDSRWNEIKDKYYCMDGLWQKRGFVVV